MTQKFAESERLEFYQPAAADYEFMRQMLIDEMTPKNQVDPVTREQIEAIIERTKKQWKKYGFGTCVAKLKSTGECIGVGGAKYISINNQQILDIGAIIKKAFQGQGYAAEAFPVFLEKTFHELNIDQVATAINPHNEPVMHLVEKMGYRYIRDVDYELDGARYQGQRYYELTREEFEKAQKTQPAFR